MASEGTLRWRNVRNGLLGNGACVAHERSEMMLIVVRQSCIPVSRLCSLFVYQAVGQRLFCSRNLFAFDVCSHISILGISRVLQDDVSTLVYTCA